MRGRGIAAGLVAGLACSPAPPSGPPGAPVDAAPVEAAERVAGPPEPAVAERCVTADCWISLADEAARLGNTDVAASHRGQAFRGDPTVARLDAWIDALIAGGEVRRAHEGLAAARALATRRRDAGLIAAIERRLAGLAEPSGTGVIAAPPLSDGLRAAYAAEVAGRLEEAAAGFAAGHAGEPYHLARAGEVAARRGAWEEARRSWSAARAGFYDRGAALRVEPVETWFTTTLAWRGDELAAMKLWGLIDDSQDNVGVLQLRAATAGAPARSLYFPRSSQVVAFTADGLEFLREERGTIVAQDLLSGAMRRPLGSPGGRVEALLTSGTGDDLVVLAAGERGAGLWDARGRLVEEFSLKGTTPTIIRAYTGEGSYHHNILQDSPTWPVALAMTDGAALVAVGGSDSKVRVFDRVRGGMRLLEFDWKYEERRHMGGNPDLNLPLAMQFDAKERLVVVHTHGDILVWDARAGRSVKHHVGRCSPTEGAADVNRYNEAGAPEKKPTEEELIGCGRATVGGVSPDATTVVTGGGLSGFRVRSVETGRTLKYVASNELPDQELVLSRTGAVGMSDLYGATAVWRPGGEVERLAPAGASSPISPWVSYDGRVLHFEVDQRDHVWDLAARRRLAVTKDRTEQVLALSGDGARAAVKLPGAIAVRTTSAGQTVFSQATAAGLSAYALAATDGTVAFWLADGTANLQLVLVGADNVGVTQAIDGPPVALSDDGRWLATGGYGHPLQVRGLRAAGRVVHTLDAGVQHVAFSRDGTKLAWLFQPDREQREVKVRAMAVEGAPELRETAVQGWPEHVAFNADGSEVWVRVESGRFVRWRPDTGVVTSVGRVPLIMTRSAVASADGRLVFMPGWDHVQVRTNDADLRRIGTIYPLLPGGWLAVSQAGAMDGSDDAVDSLITRVVGSDETQVFPGRLGWEGARVAGTAARLLGGEDVAPPVLERPPPPAEEALGR